MHFTLLLFSDSICQAAHDFFASQCIHKIQIQVLFSVCCFGKKTNEIKKSKNFKLAYFFLPSHYLVTVVKSVNVSQLEVK